jgi:hypothetical protein
MKVPEKLGRTLIKGQIEKPVLFSLTDAEEWRKALKSETNRR